MTFRQLPQQDKDAAMHNSHIFALETYRTSLEDTIRSYGPWHLNTGAAFSTIGTYCSRVGMLVESLAMYEKDLQISKTCLADENDPRVAGAHYNVGLTLCRLGRYDAALPHLEAALRSRRSAPDPQLLDIADTESCIGGALVRLGLPGDALVRYESALACRRAVLPPEHLSVAQGMLDLATAHRALGQWAAAAQHASAAQAVLGPDHPRAAAAAQVLHEASARLAGTVRPATSHIFNISQLQTCLLFI